MKDSFTGITRGNSKERNAREIDCGIYGYGRIRSHDHSYIVS